MSKRFWWGPCHLLWADFGKYGSKLRFDHNHDIWPTFGCNKDENRSFGPIFDNGTPLHSGLSHFGSQNGLVTPPAIVPKIQKIGQDTRGTSTPPMVGSGEALNPIFGDFKGAVTHDFVRGSFLHSVFASNVTPVEENAHWYPFLIMVPPLHRIHRF